VTAERFRARSGSTLHVLDTGPGEATGRGRTLLALHGLGGGAWFFTGLARRLAPEHRVIAVDLPGTGRSTSSAPFSLSSWTADLADLVDERAGEPVVLLGHSMGTIAALHAWSSGGGWQARIRGLIFAGGLPEPRAPIKERLMARAESVARAGLSGVGPQAAPANFSRATLEHQPELVGLWETLFEAQDPDTYVRWCRMLIEASAVSVVPTVTVPCLSVSGTEDQYAPPDLVEAFVRRLPGPARAEFLAGCGHLPFLEQPAAFAAAVRSFLSTLC
jgi:3-oxoadipate enol-lactonase